MTLLVRQRVYSVSSVACVSTGQGEGSLAALCSRPLSPWINADCLGMTRSSGPHRKSGGNVDLRGAAVEGRRGKPTRQLAQFPSSSILHFILCINVNSLHRSPSPCFLCRWPLTSWGQSETPFPGWQPLPALLLMKAKKLWVCKSACEWMIVGGLKQCGREDRMDKDSSKKKQKKNTDADFN